MTIKHLSLAESNECEQLNKLHESQYFFICNMKINLRRGGGGITDDMCSPQLSEHQNKENDNTVN